jgi:hypothetical protein
MGSVDSVSGSKESHRKDTKVRQTIARLLCVWRASACHRASRVACMDAMVPIRAGSTVRRGGLDWRWWWRGREQAGTAVKRIVRMNREQGTVVLSAPIGLGRILFSGRRAKGEVGRYARASEGSGPSNEGGGGRRGRRRGHGGVPATRGEETRIANRDSLHEARVIDTCGHVDVKKTREWSGRQSGGVDARKERGAGGCDRRRGSGRPPATCPRKGTAIGVEQ